MAKMTPPHLLERNTSWYQRNKLAVRAVRKERRNTTVEGRMLAIIGNARARARKLAWEYDLTQDFLVQLWHKQEGKCALTGAPMDVAQSSSRWKGNQVSLDRIDPSKGYTKDNVWLVSTKANYAKGVQSYEEFVEFCKTVVENANNG